MRSIWKAYQDPNLADDYFRLEVFVLRALGIEMYRKETFWYSIYSKIILFLTIVIYTGLESYEFFFQWGGDLMTIAFVTNYLFTHLMGVMEVTLLYLNRKKLGQMMLSLHRAPYQPDEGRGAHIETIWIRQVIKITETMYALFGLTLCLAISANAFEAIVGRITKPQEEWKMAFAPMSIGEFVLYSPFYELAIIYQLCEITIFGFLMLSTYFLLSTIMGHISVQLRILANGLRNLRQRAENSRRSQNQEVINKEMDKLMRGTINHHLKVLDLASEMESLSSLSNLLIFIFSVILMCFLLYFGSLYPIGSPEFFHFFFFWLCIFCQVGTYCYWGNEVSIEAEKVAQAAQDVDWPGASKHVTNAIVMITMRAQRPLYITAGKFVPLSLEILMNIVKGSFSYFMVLRETQGKAELIE